MLILHLSLCPLFGYFMSYKEHEVLIWNYTYVLDSGFKRHTSSSKARVIKVYLEYDTVSNQKGSCRQ